VGLAVITYNSDTVLQFVPLMNTTPSPFLSEVGQISVWFCLEEIVRQWLN